MTKDELRKTYLRKRLALSEVNYSHFNNLLCTKFFDHADLSSINVLHTFLPMEKNKEPDTWLIIDRLKREFPHIQITIPKVNNKSHVLENFYFEEALQLEPN